MDAAADCRRNGWQVGDILRGDEGWGFIDIVITAIGETRVLARRQGGWESLWDLSARPWVRVGSALPRSSDCDTPWVDPCECYSCCGDAKHPTDETGRCNCGTVGP